MTKYLPQAFGFSVIGTPDDAIAKIQELVEASNGGFGAFLPMDDDWAPPAAKLHSYELFAQHVIPHFTGQLGLRSLRRTGSSAAGRRSWTGLPTHRQGHRRPRRGTGSRDRQAVAGAVSINPAGACIWAGWSA